VRLAFDADDAGELAAAQAAARLQAIGIECYRVRFPWGMDANTFALNRDGEALCQAVRSAEWLGGKSLQKSGVPAAACKVPVAPLSTVNLVASSLAAGSVAEREEFLAAPTPANPVALAQRGEHHELQLGDRAYRVGGLDKNSTPEVMKITLRVMEPGCLMHIDSLDLYRDGERRKFIERAAEETGLTQDLLKRDLGKLLLALEQCQEERLAAAHATSQDAAAAMSIEDRRDADNFLTLIDAVTLLHQRQRQRITLPSGRTALVATLADIQTANRLAPEVLGRSLDELPAQTRRLWDEIKRLALEAQVARGWKHYSFTRRELRERVGWSVTQVRTHLERLHELEYIVPRHGRNGVRFDYGLLLDPGQAEGPDKIGLIDVKSLKPVKPCDYAANLTGESPRLTGKNAHLSPPDNPPVSGSSPDAAGLSAPPDGLAQPHIRAAGKSASGIVA
jgi:hypothetical protein